MSPASDLEISFDARPGPWVPSRSPMSSSSDSSDSAATMVQIPIFQGVGDRRVPIKTRSRTRFCMLCKQPGHHLGNCVAALEERVKHEAVDCRRGYHYPFLHGVWRCEWCWEHLHERDVKRLLPELWKRETAKEAVQWDKYMDSNLHVWQ